MPHRLRKFQTTAVRQRAFPSPGKCAGLGLLRLLVHLNTGPSFTLLLGPTLALTLGQHPPVPNSLSSKNFKTRSKLWIRFYRNCILLETSPTTITIVGIFKLLFHLSVASPPNKVVINCMLLPSGRGLSAQCSLSMGGSSDCPSALCSNGASGSTSFRPSLPQHQDGSNSTDKLRYTKNTKL